MSSQDYWDIFGGPADPLDGPDYSFLHGLPAGGGQLLQNIDEPHMIQGQLEQWDLDGDNALSEYPIPSIEDPFDWGQRCLIHAHPTPTSVKDCQLQSVLSNPVNDWGTVFRQSAPSDMLLGGGRCQQHGVLFDSLTKELSFSPDTEPPATPIGRRPPPIRRAKARSASGCKAKAQKCQSNDCSKNFVPGTSNDGTHCRSCTRKILKNVAGPPVLYFEPSIRSFADAWERVYPTLTELMYHPTDGTDADDYHQHEDSEDYWVQQFIEAANMPYTEESRAGPTGNPERDDHQHEYFLCQQQTYNKKPVNDASRDHFNNDEVNVRMRFLFRAVMTFHRGGHTVYPCGGDNRGYGEDHRLKCSDRLRLIRDIMAKDKRVLVTVIEGRGVNAFAANPKKYADRKTNNKISNESKKRLIAKGTQREMEDGSRPARRNRHNNVAPAGFRRSVQGSGQPEASSPFDATIYGGWQA